MLIRENDYKERGQNFLGLNMCVAQSSMGCKDSEIQEEHSFLAKNAIYKLLLAGV